MDRNIAAGPAGQAPQRFSRLGRALAWAGIAAAGLGLLWLLGDMLLPFLVGAGVAYFLDPAVRRLEGLGLPRLVASLGMMLLLFGALVAAVVWVVPLALNEAAALSRALPDIFEDAKSWLGRATGEDVEDEDSTVYQLVQDAAEALRENAQTLAMGLLSGATALINLLVFWVVMPVVAFYLLMDWPRLVAAIDAHVPRDQVSTIRRLARDIDATLAGFVRGEVIVCTMLAAY